jgi:hypothetical protein
MEQLPHTLQRFYAVVGVEQVEPSSPLKLQHMPRLTFGCWEGAFAVGKDVQIPPVDAEVED